MKRTHAEVYRVTSAILTALHLEGVMIQLDGRESEKVFLTGDAFQDYVRTLKIRHVITEELEVQLLAEMESLFQLGDTRSLAAHIRGIDSSVNDTSVRFVCVDGFDDYPIPCGGIVKGDTVLTEEDVYTFVELFPHVEALYTEGELTVTQVVSVLQQAAASKLPLDNEDQMARLQDRKSEVERLIQEEEDRELGNLVALFPLTASEHRTVNGLVEGLDLPIQDLAERLLRSGGKKASA